MLGSKTVTDDRESQMWQWAGFICFGNVAVECYFPLLGSLLPLSQCCLGGPTGVG